MAIAISQKASAESKIVELDSDVHRLKYFLKSLKGTKVLTFEESTASQDEQRPELLEGDASLPPAT
jgi:hypothetical protein